MRLAFVGDIALGDHPKAVGFGFRSRYPRGIPPALAGRLLPPGTVPDLLFGNFEFALGLDPTRATAVTELQCRGLNEYATFLATAGVSALNVANNHCSQHGLSVFSETVEVLRSAGIHIVGTPGDFTEAGVMRVGGRRVALLGWSDRPRQYAEEQPPYNEFSELAYARIAEARSRADLVIASIHWGQEFILVPSERERTIAHSMIDAGASFVIGHHPHVLREIETYRGGTIAYSLGNFVGDMTWDARNRLSGWLTAEIENSRVVSCELTRAVVADDYFPRPATDPMGRRLSERLQAAGREQGEKVAVRGYERVAETERKHHELRTAWMMLRNLPRYPRGVAGELFRGAFSHRLTALLRRVLGTSPAIS